MEPGAHMTHGDVRQEHGVRHDKLEKVRASDDNVAHVVVGQGVAAAGQVELMEIILVRTVYLQSFPSHRS